MTGQLRFYSLAATAGLVVALVVTVAFPGWLGLGSHPSQSMIPSSSMQAPNARTFGPVSYADGVARTAPAVVNITTQRAQVTPETLSDLIDGAYSGERFVADGSTSRGASLGSGVLMTAAGHILTNHHVIENADAMAVVLATGEAFPAEIIGIDPDTDLAVLRIAATHILPAAIGRSRDLRVGDVVLAIGNPFGVGQTVTQGIVSATGRSELGITLFEDFIQTDAAINPGNSGGALINAHGELIGINTVIFSRSGGSHGIGFAIPVDLAREVMHEIIEKGYVARGWLGIEVQALNQALVESFGLEDSRGVLIAGILQRGPAYRAGLQPGDVIVGLEGQRVDSARQALNIIARKRPGEPISIEARRNGEALHVETWVDQRPI
jgi:serine protease DegS